MMLSATEPFGVQYEALRGGRALVELADWSSISIAGKDRQAFLHNFCTNDVKRLAPGDCCEAFITNVKGKCVGHGLVMCGDEELNFLGAPGQAARLVDHLDRYVIREDVRLRDTTTEREFYLATGGALPGCFLWNIVGNESTAVSWIESGGLFSVVEAFGADREIVVVGRDAFEAARIEAAFPFYGVDFDESNLPQEVGRDREAISFTKGCYLGQETVARIDALGHVNQRIVGVRCRGDATTKVGTELKRDGATVGRVTSAAFSPQLGSPLALAMIRKEANAVGTQLECSNSECEVAELSVKGNE
jgi:tRNA-modifying protein YgfZ